MRRLWIVLLVLTAAFVMAAPAGAAKPMNVSIDLFGTDVSGTTDYAAPTGLTFDATGTAVDEGLICALATERVREDLSTSRKLQLYVRFDCADGSGDFHIKLQGRNPGEGSAVSWLIYGAHRSGTGKGIVTVKGPVTGDGYKLTGNIK